MGGKPTYQDQLRRVNRTLRMVNAFGRILIRERDENQLLGEICRIIIEIGGYHLAWVGFAQHDENKTILPVAHCGYEDGYLDTLKITWADVERGHGPTGTAVRTGTPIICRNILSDPAFTPWRDDAIRRGYRSSIAIPLKTNDDIMGALNIYTKETNAFDHEEIELLQKLGDELVYGITALRIRAEKERAEDALRKNQALLNDTQRITKVGGWEFDPVTLKGTWTDETARIHDMDPQDEITTEVGMSFYRGEHRKTIERAVKEAVEYGKPYDLELEMVTAKGNHKWVRTIGRPIKEGDKVVSVRGSFQDITEKKLEQVELAIHRKYLEEMVDNRTRDLTEKTARLEETQKALTFLLEDVNESREEIELINRELEAVNRELKDFAYIVSHDLKAPLRAVSQLAFWISQDYADSFDHEGKAQLNLLINRVKRMDALINGILDYSRLSRSRAKKESIDLNDMLADCVESLAPPEHIRIIVASDLPAVNSDPTRMTQVFQNLIGNAIKFMDKPQGVVQVECSDTGDEWEFRITDNGPGIEEKYFDRIFQIFQTLTPRDEQESTGIGLTLVKKIVEQLGGKIWLESKTGHGSTFFFTLTKQ